MQQVDLDRIMQNSTPTLQEVGFKIRLRLRLRHAILKIRIWLDLKSEHLTLNPIRLIFYQFFILPRSVSKYSSHFILHSLQDVPLTYDIFYFLLVKNIKSWYYEFTHWDESNKSPHEYVFLYTLIRIFGQSF